MNQLRRTTQPTTNGPISPLRMARATSLATIRQVDTQPASTAHTMSTMQTATPHGIVILAPPPQPPPRRQFPEHRPCNQSAIMVEPRRRSNEFRRIHDSDRKRTHLLSCRCRQHSARKNRNKLRLAPILVPIDPERESARILSTSNRRKRFASPRRCLIKRWGSISLPSLPPNPRFALPTPVWRPPKRGIFNRIRIGQRRPLLLLSHQEPAQIRHLMINCNPTTSTMDSLISVTISSKQIIK